MVKFVLGIFERSLKICGGTPNPNRSATTAAESMERVLNGRITTRCFLVLSFWMLIASLVVVVILFGGPRLWTLIRAVASPS